MPVKALVRKETAPLPIPKRAKTRLTIHYDCGFPNHLAIRGAGANLSWKKGLRLKNIKADEWVFETDEDFHKCEFKILLNDEIYESGQNRVLVCGTSSYYTPKF